jgi:hypothetical protein
MATRSGSNAQYHWAPPSFSLIKLRSCPASGVSPPCAECGLTPEAGPEQVSLFFLSNPVSFQGSSAAASLHRGIDPSIQTPCHP